MRYEAFTQRLLDAAIAAPGHTPSELRRAVLGRAARLAGARGGAPAPAPFGSYVDKVAQHAYKVTDEDVAALQAAGNSDDAVFEVTVAAAALLDLMAGTAGVPAAGGSVSLPPRRDTDWPGALPPEAGVRELDEIPADVVRKLLTAGERTFREASAGADPRAVGDALLDHEVLTVSAGDASATVPLRLLLGLARMGFLGDDPLRIGLAGGWVRAAASYGVAYRRRSRLSLLPTPR